MSAPEIDSPFQEKKSNPLVWIIPSVALHVIVLIVWLTLPEEPPRKPTNRKMTINSQQAEQLQQHVEDANLVVLQSQVSELQAIKRAMSQIRENKMDQLRSFEEQMVVVAPKDAIELFGRLLEAQTNIITAYQLMLESAQARVKLEPAAKALLAEVQIEKARPLLIEIKAHWDDVRAQMRTVKNETDQIFALINTADVQLAWILDPSIERQFSDLKAAMEVARQANSKVDSNLNKSFSGRSSDSLKNVVEKGEVYAQTLQRFEQATVDGKLAVEAKRAELQQKMAASETAIVDLTQLKADLRQQIEALPKSDKTKLNQLYGQAKKTETAIVNAGKQLGQARATLSKLKDYKLSYDAEKKIKQIHATLNGIFVADPELQRMTDAMKAQVAFTRSAKDLLAILVEQAAQGEVAQP